MFLEYFGFVTNVPFPCLRTTSPFSIREPTAFRTVIRLTPYSLAISASVMILSPGL